MPNRGGGSIALTNVPCKSKEKSWVAYSYLKSGESFLGCWVMESERVFIIWNDGDLRSYDANYFIMTGAKKYL